MRVQLSWRPRRSTVALVVTWIAVFVLWLVVRPEPTPPSSEFRGVFVPTPTTTVDAGGTEPSAVTEPVTDTGVDTTVGDTAPGAESPEVPGTDPAGAGPGAGSGGAADATTSTAPLVDSG